MSRIVLKDIEFEGEMGLVDLRSVIGGAKAKPKPKAKAKPAPKKKAKAPAKKVSKVAKAASNPTVSVPTVAPPTPSAPATSAPAASTPTTVASSNGGSMTSNGTVTNDPSASNSVAHNHQTDGIHDTNNRIGNNGFGTQNNEGARRVTRKGGAWDVWFDNEDAFKSTASGANLERWSPIVLDLDGNGKADITGSNITGNGAIEGNTVMFDIDPSRSAKTFSHFSAFLGSYYSNLFAGEIGWMSLKSIDGGIWTKEKLVAAGGECKTENGEVLAKVFRFNLNGNYEEKRERTEWLQKGTGDGFLAWDVDGDGKITSNKEMFGNFDIDGSNRFQHGYQKLASYFDRNGDGEVRHEELLGLKVWRDANADGVTQDGELTDAVKVGVSYIKVRDINLSDYSSSFVQDGVLKSRAVVNSTHAKLRDASDVANSQRQFEVSAGEIKVATDSGFVRTEVLKHNDLTSGNGTMITDAFTFRRTDGTSGFGMKLDAGAELDVTHTDVHTRTYLATGETNIQTTSISFTPLTIAKTVALDLDGDGHISTIAASALPEALSLEKWTQIERGRGWNAIFTETIEKTKNHTRSVSMATGRDAFLAVDLDNDGRIGHSRELVDNGFFASLDTNRDGVINKADTDYSRIKLVRIEADSSKAPKKYSVWTLDQEGIAEIPLATLRSAGSSINAIAKLDVGLSATEESALKNQILTEAKKFTGAAGDASGQVNLYIESDGKRTETANAMEIYKQAQISPTSALSSSPTLKIV